MATTIRSKGRDPDLQGQGQRRHPGLGGGLDPVGAAEGTRGGARCRLHRPERRWVLADELLGGPIGPDDAGLGRIFRANGEIPEGGNAVNPQTLKSCSTLPFAGTGDSPTAVGLFSAIVTGLYRRERTGKGSYVTTSLLAEGIWSASVAIQAALCEAKFSPQHDRKNPANAAMNVYKSSDDIWFLLVVTPDKLPAVATGIGRADLLKEPRFADPSQLTANMSQLTAIVDEIFSAQPMAHWREVLDRANITYGLVRDPTDVIKDPQLRENGIVVPLQGAGGNLKATISSPIQVHGVTKEPAKRAPELGEHSEEILEQLGFDAKEIDGFRTSGTLGKPKQPVT